MFGYGKLFIHDGISRWKIIYLHIHTMEFRYGKLLVLMGYATSNGICDDIIWIMRHQKEYATSFLYMVYIHKIFSTPFTNC